MEALTSSSSSSSSSKQFFFVKKSHNRNRGGGGGWKTLFTTRRTELGFFKCKNVDFSHSISLQLIKAIQPVSCCPPPPTFFPSSSEQQVTEGGGDMMMMMTTEEEAPTQETYTGKAVHVKFLLQKECTFGEQLLLVGDDPIFGMWNPSDAIPLDWSEGHIWSVELDIPVEKLIRFKFILKGTTVEEFVWQPDPDRMLQTWETKNTIVVSENWEIAEAQTITEEEPGDYPIQEPTADKSSELNLSEDMSNPKEDLVVADKLSNPKEVLLIQDNTSYPKEELLVADNRSYPKEELLVADNISNPKEKQTVGENQDVVGSNNIRNPREEQTVENQDLVGSNGIAVDSSTSVDDDDEDDLVDYEGEPVLVPGLAPFPTTVSKGSLPAVVDTVSTKTVENQDVVGSNSIAVTVDRLIRVDDDEDDLVEYEGEPVLVPGLTPFPTTVPKGSLPAVVDTISTKDASVELNGNAVEVEDGNIPEKYKKKDLDENTHQENTTATKISDDGPAKENNVPEELPLFQLEQTSFLELLRSGLDWANRRVRQLLKDLGLF